MSKEEVKSLIIIGWNLHQKLERNILTKKSSEKYIDDVVKKYLEDNENSND